MSNGGGQAPISLFYSYSHKDEKLRQKLEVHLASLRRSGMIAEWYDRNIDVGQEWEKEIDRHLSSADIILLLVSASFIASEYCWSVEVKKALERHERGEATVIPVILRRCRWCITPFAKLQAAPKGGKPVTAWADQDAAFDDVAANIQHVVADFQRKRGRLQPDDSERQPHANVKATAERWLRAPPVMAPPGKAFRDIEAPWCPEMVALPSGEFLMGSPKSEEGRFEVEGPQHKVMIGRRFAIGRYPATVGEYRHFVEATGRRLEGGMYAWTGSEWKQDSSKSWRDPGFGQTDRHPVVGVSWRDAQAYIQWLAAATGKPHRLPSEAEWEYACRAGTTTRYAFGDAITPKAANYSESKLRKTTEVGTYPPNAWSLYDMHGNVWEWVEDVWHEGYKGAPTDGSAWTGGEGHNSSRDRVIRGGSWINRPGGLRSADRVRYGPDDRGSSLGFRVAQTLD